MRVGPGKNYPGSWLYKRRDLPVRVLKVQPNWRLIEDPDGQRGWMLVTLLSDRRTAIVRPGSDRMLYERPEGGSRVSYKVAPGVVGQLSECARNWCVLTVGKQAGYVRYDDIWGITPGENW